MPYLRFLLAVAVVHGHLVALNVFWQQRIAVFGFFLLSGFLITLVANECYSGSCRGKLRFLQNRIVRIYPLYFCCLVVASAAVYYLYGPAAHRIQHFWLYLPSTAREWLPHITIIGLTPLTEVTRITGPLHTSWSLGTELVYYMVIGLITGTSRKLTWGLFALSLMVVAYYYQNKFSHMYMYKTVIGPGAVFFLGSLTYHYRNTLKRFCVASRPLALFCAFIIVFLPDMVMTNHHYRLYQMPYMHLACFAFAWVVLSIYHAEQGKNISRLEQFFADISYPVFLLHLSMGALARHLFDIHQKIGYGVFFTGLGITLAVSTLVVLLVDHPLKKLRKRIRDAAKAESTRPASASPPT